MEPVASCHGAANQLGRAKAPLKKQSALPWVARCPRLSEALVTQTRRPSSAAARRRPHSPVVSRPGSPALLRIKSAEAGDTMMRSASDVLTPVKQSKGTRKMSRVNSLLTSIGYDFLFEDSLEKESVASSIAKLRDFEKAQGLSRLALIDIESELIAGTCKLKVDQAGGIRRQITVQALQLRRESDNYIMVHVGTWTKSRGLRVTCFLPGGKQEVGLKTDVHIKRLIQNELTWLLQDYNLKLTKNNVTVSTKPSDRYGVSTTYERIVFEGVAWKKRDLDEDVEERQSSYATLVVEFKNDVQESDDTSSSSGEETQGEESVSLESTPVLGVFRSMTEVALYAWIDPDSWAAKQSEDRVFAERMKAWAGSFQENIERYIEGMELLESYQCQHRSARINAPDKPRCLQQRRFVTN